MNANVSLVITLQTEIEKLKKQIVELEAENKELRRIRPDNDRYDFPFFSLPIYIERSFNQEHLLYQSCDNSIMRFIYLELLSGTCYQRDGTFSFLYKENKRLKTDKNGELLFRTIFAPLCRKTKRIIEEMKENLEKDVKIIQSVSKEDIEKDENLNALSIDIGSRERLIKRATETYKEFKSFRNNIPLFAQKLDGIIKINTIPMRLV